MEKYKTNLMTIDNIFKSIESHFVFTSDNAQKKILFKNISHSNLRKRPNIKKHNKHDKILPNEKSNQLDLIGNDDLIFNNDKLITSMKIGDIEEISDDSNEASNEKDKEKDIYSSPKKVKRSKKRSLTPTREKRVKQLQKYNSPKKHKKVSNNKNNDSLLLDINKSSYNNSPSKTSNQKSKINKNYIQMNRVKNISQFINKPNDNSNQKNLLMTPANNKVSSKITPLNSFTKINNIKITSKTIDNDSISLASASRLATHSCIRGRSMPNQSKKSNVHFPNKSIIKNKDKLLNGLQKIFGDRLQLVEDLYQNMTDLDKKTCINFLLESVKELFNFIKIAQSKSDVFKDVLATKEKNLKEAKNEIKELKKDNTKLNKIIKTNIQMNRKLSQNIDSLKLQLEKEKNKNKELQTRGKSVNKNNRNTSRAKNRNDMSGLNLTITKKNKRNMSQDKLLNTSEFVNKKKNDDNNNKKEKEVKNDKINSKEKEPNNQSDVKKEDNKDFITLPKDINDPLLVDINIGKDINLTDNLNLNVNEEKKDNQANDN
jgi:hypothetical protein